MTTKFYGYKNGDCRVSDAKYPDCPVEDFAFIIGEKNE